jgi:rubrerythrin
MIEPRDLNSVDEVLDFAIAKESEAAAFYTEWAQTVKNKAISGVLLEFAEEEKKHEAFIKDVRSGKQMPEAPKDVTDLSISDYLVEEAPSEDMDYQATLIVAMQREKSAFRLYSKLASVAQQENVKKLFLTLAQEEAKHKLRLETIYDDDILRDN